MDELRKALEDAFQQDDVQDEIKTTETVAEPEATAPPDEPAESPSDEPESPRSDEPQTEASDRVAKTEPAEAPKEKAPASWSPKAREAWGKLPAEAQAEVMKREREVNKVLQETAGARNLATQLNATLAPFRDQMIASGVRNPLEAIGGLLATESRLRSGNHQEKALMVANIIKNYGVDIGELDNVLSGQGASSAPSGNSDIERLLEQRLAPMNSFIQQQQMQLQQQAMYEEQQAAQSVQSFSAQAEFINEVRMDMADLLDMAAKRGQAMTIEQAYTKACAIHPEVSSVMAQRQKQQQLMGTQSDIQRKKAAASSITGQRGGATSAKGAESLRDSIAAAWDSQMTNF